MRARARGRLSAAAFAAAALLAACAPRFQPMGTHLVQPELRGHHFYTRDGLDLPVRIWLPDGKPKAVFLALHGFNDYSNAFVEPANYWTRSGIATYAYDQRGFGETPHRGYWPGVAALADDAGDMVRLLHKRYPHIPLFLIGESMGGAVAIVTAASDRTLPIAGLILAAPAVWARDTMNPFQSGLLWLAAHSVPWMTVTGRGLHILASDNIAMLRALARDPLVIKETRIDTIYGLANLMDAAMTDASKLKVPTLLLYGDKDEVVPRDPTMEFLAHLKKVDPEARAVLYPKGYHMLLRDLSADTVMKDVAAWVRNRDGRLPSGDETRAASAR